MLTNVHSINMFRGLCLCVCICIFVYIMLLLYNSCFKNVDNNTEFVKDGTYIVSFCIIQCLFVWIILHYRCY